MGGGRIRDFVKVGEKGFDTWAHGGVWRGDEGVGVFWVSRGGWLWLGHFGVGVLERKMGWQLGDQDLRWTTGSFRFPIDLI